ncbi:MAG TPA: hypothetical protein VIY27_07865 [Myxococcota bacterium]
MLEAEQIIRRLQRGLEDQAGTATSGSERGHFEICAGVASLCANAVRAAASTPMPTSREELSRLADYILQHRGGEIVDGESAVDAAIRLLGKT